MATPIKIRNLVAPAGGLLVVSGPSNIKWLLLINTSAAVAFVQLFNAIAGVTLGTTTPDLEFLLPANTGFVSVALPDGCGFPVGIIAASTTTEGGAVASAAGVQVFIGV